MIYVDADACPVKEEVVRVAVRHGVPVRMVSGQGLRPWREPDVLCVTVGDKFDAADDWIVEHVSAQDIVITADIRLAGRCVEKNAQVIGANGQPFTKESIGSALAMRELNQYLREAGEISGHNASFSAKNRSDFLQALERLVQKSKIK